MYPAPQLLFNVAKAYDKLAVPSSALSFYREYLRKLPDAPDAADVGNRVRELEAMLAQRGVQQLSVLTNPPRALLAMDGMPVGITPWTGETWPGEHRLTITLDGHKALTALVTVDALRAEDYSYDLEATDPSNTAKDRASAAASKSSTQVSTLTWLVLGTGTAALGATLVAEMAAKNTRGLTRTGAFFGGIGIADLGARRRALVLGSLRARRYADAETACLRGKCQRPVLTFLLGHDGTWLRFTPSATLSTPASRHFWLAGATRVRANHSRN